MRKSPSLWHLWRLFFLGMALLVVWLPGQANAKDVRLALLVGNQHGWHGDPTLRYAISGDLQPMEQVLRRAGFTIFRVLANQSPDALRQAFRDVLQRTQQAPEVTTFFFYYTGHADKRHFHMGTKGTQPLSYREFVLFLHRLKVKRRFSIIDACFSGEIIRVFGNLKSYRELLQKGMAHKGVMRQLRRHDLLKHFPSRGGQVRGLQILSSSRHLSFESPVLRGSVFTHYVLRGLKGEADLNQDGQISFNELFLYVKPKVVAQTRQNPLQWLFRVGGEAYGFVPVYQSQLHVAAATVGQLQIVIGNFVWRYTKRTQQRVKLAVASGHGHVEWVKGQQCFRQQLFFPKGGAAALQSEGWKGIRCGHALLVQKGGVEIAAERVPFRPMAALNLELQAGAWLTTGALHKEGDLSGALMLGLRWQYLAIFVGILGTSVGFAQVQSTQLGVELRMESGYRRHWGRFSLMAGGYATGMLLFQDVNLGSRVAWTFHFGATTTVGWWMSELVALTLTLDLGMLPGRVQEQWRLFGVGGGRLGVRFLL